MMRLTCPACGARYAVADDAIPPQGRAVQCSACQAEWRAKPEAAAPEGPQAAPQPPIAQPPVVAQDMAPPVAAPASVVAAKQHPAAMIASLQDEPPARGRGGFLAGFVVVMLLTLAAVTLYAKHAAIAAAVPALTQPLAAYVAAVDKGRVALADAVETLRAR